MGKKRKTVNRKGQRKYNRADVIKRYESGEPVISIAKDYGVSREGIYLSLRKLPDFKGLSDKLHHDRMSDSRKKNSLIRTLIEKGYSNDEMIEAIGVSKLRVSKVRSSLRKERNAEIFRLHSEGVRNVEIAKRLGMTQNNVSNTVCRHYKK